MSFHVRERTLHLQSLTSEGDPHLQRHLQIRLARRGAEPLELARRLAPSPELWRHLLERSTELAAPDLRRLDAALDAGWPDALRVAPSTWLETPSEHTPRWPLARRLNLDRDLARAALKAPLDAITWLDFSDASWVSASLLVHLFAHLDLCRVRTLRLGSVMHHDIELNARSSYLRRDALRAWEALLHGPARLHRLELRGASDGLLEAIASAQPTARLTHLAIDDIRSRTPLALRDARFLEHLEVLSLSDTYGLHGVDAVLERCPRLHTLSLKLSDPESLTSTLDALHASGAALRDLTLTTWRGDLPPERVLDHPATRHLERLTLDSRHVHIETLRAALSRHNLHTLTLSHARISARRVPELARADVDDLHLSASAVTAATLKQWRSWRPLHSDRDDLRDHLLAIFSVANESALRPETRWATLGPSPSPLRTATQTLASLPITGRYPTLYLALRDFGGSRVALVLAGRHEGGALDVLHVASPSRAYLHTTARELALRILGQHLGAERLITDAPPALREALQETLPGLVVRRCPRDALDALRWRSPGARDRVRRVLRALRRGWMSSSEAARELEALGVAEPEGFLSEIALDDSLNPLDRAGLGEAIEALRVWAPPGEHVAGYLRCALALRRLGA